MAMHTESWVSADKNSDLVLPRMFQITLERIICDEDEYMMHLLVSLQMNDDPWKEDLFESYLFEQNWPCRGGRAVPPFLTLIFLLWHRYAFFIRAFQAEKIISEYIILCIYFKLSRTEAWGSSFHAGNANRVNRGAEERDRYDGQ